MEQLCKDIEDLEPHSDDAKTLPTGKSTSSSVCHSLKEDDSLDEAKLELESAQFEIEVAEAMKRAAEAKRRAAEVLRYRRGREDSGPPIEVIRLEEGRHTRLVLSNTDKAPPEQHMEKPGVPFERAPGDTVGNQDVIQLSTLLSRLELPKCELPHFDGSPLQYVLFFRQFEEAIEANVDDNSKRLTFLYHYCQGKAKDAIRGCLLYPASEGYSRARTILKELFGQRHFIVRAMLDEVTGPEAVGGEAEDLSAYANKLVTCADALE